VAIIITIQTLRLVVLPGCFLRPRINLQTPAHIITTHPAITIIMMPVVHTVTAMVAEAVVRMAAVVAAVTTDWRG